jgi:putative ABC transport system substrate-binding protein
VGDATYRAAFAEIDRDRPDAILVSEATESYQRAGLVVELINQTRISALYPARDYAEAGGLMTYAIDVEDLFRHMAHQ